MRFINTNDYVFDIGQSSFDLVQDGDSFYPMGGSMVPLVLAKDNDDDTLCTLIYYDKPANTVRNPQYTTGDQLSGTLRQRANPGTSLVTVQGSSYLVDLSADINDDGTTDNADGQLKTARLGKCIGINNNDDPYSGEDDLQEVALTYRGNADVGVAWVEYDDTTMKLWEDLARTQEVLPGSAASPNWNLASDTAPAHLYIEGLASSGTINQNVVLRFSIGGIHVPRTVEISASLGISIVTFGDAGYFRYVRSFLNKSNRKVFKDDIALDGGFANKPDFMLLAVRREKATLAVYDAKSNDKTGVDAVRIANPDADIVANGTFFTMRTLLNPFGEWTVGTVINGGAEIANISKRVTQWNDWFAKNKRLPNYRGFLGQKSDGSIVFQRSNAKGEHEAVDQTPLPSAALSGLIAFIPRAKEEAYSTLLKKMNDAHPSQYQNAMSHIGYANEHQEDILFLLFSPGNDNVYPHLYPTDLDRGMSGGLFEKLVESGCSVCYGLDGGSSVGVAYKDYLGIWEVQAEGAKHKLFNWRVNNYVILTVAP